MLDSRELDPGLLESYQGHNCTLQSHQAPLSGTHLPLHSTLVTRLGSCSGDPDTRLGDQYRREVTCTREVPVKCYRNSGGEKPPPAEGIRRGVL